MYGRGSTANSSRRVGVFNGEWSHLRFLMTIRGGNWLRFTVSLTTQKEEGENRIKASGLCVSEHRCETKKGSRNTLLTLHTHTPIHPPTHFHTSTSRGNVSLKPTAAQLTEPNESGLNFTLSCPSF